MVINLENTKFELSAMVGELPMTCAFKGKKFVQVTDFGTVYIGSPNKDDRACSDPQKGAPAFTAPAEWTFAHLMAALGAFPSVSQARKNGWNREIPHGCSSVLVRISKIRGEVWIHKL